MLEQSLNNFKTKADAVTMDEKSNEKSFKKEFIPEFQINSGDTEEVLKAYRNAKLTEEIDTIDYIDELIDRTPTEIFTVISEKFLDTPVVNPLNEDDPYYVRFQEILVEKYRNDVRHKVISAVSD